MSSTEGYVLPHLVEVATASEGVVSRIFVRERDLVTRGQDLLEIHGPAPCDPAVVIRSSAHGVVSRCRVRVGDAVVRARPVLSIVGADDVLVVARFDASAGTSLRHGVAASVRIPRATAALLAATILRVDGGRGESRSARDVGGGVRVVARLESAPPAALWPGIEAVVHVARAGGGRDRSEQEPLRLDDRHEECGDHAGARAEQQRDDDRSRERAPR